MKCDELHITTLKCNFYHIEFQNNKQPTTKNCKRHLITSHKTQKLRNSCKANSMHKIKSITRVNILQPTCQGNL